MRGVQRFVLGSAIALLLSPLPAHGNSMWAKQALSPDAEVARDAIANLRREGVQGLDTFLATYAQPLATETLPSPALRTVLDTLCQQRDCHASRLFWYTDLKAARAQAQRTGKPILSLRLLGNLNEELSCANSRFFRVALYANTEISDYLRQNYILHWQSVRPVPTVTIDFGDGRQLKRTLTGNSIHYVLAPSGQPLEALPGLYGPQAFLRHLQQGTQLSAQFTQQSVTDQPQFLRRYHRDRIASTQAQWRADLNQIGRDQLPPLAPETPAAPTAIDAGRLAMAKATLETSLVAATVGQAEDRDRTLEQLAQATNTEAWTEISQLHAQDAQLDASSRRLMRLKGGSTGASDWETTMRSFEAAMALDTVRNEYGLRTQIHQWFAQGEGTADVTFLNVKVYEQLFLTPDRDPWLGLRSPSVYSAIEQDGLQ